MNLAGTVFSGRGFKDEKGKRPGYEKRFSGKDLRNLIEVGNRRGPRRKGGGQSPVSPYKKNPIGLCLGMLGSGRRLSQKP